MNIMVDNEIKSVFAENSLYLTAAVRRFIRGGGHISEVTVNNHCRM